MQSDLPCGTGVQQGDAPLATEPPVPAPVQSDAWAAWAAQSALPPLPVTSKVVDADDLNALLVSWYSAGYYTGRYEALQQAGCSPLLAAR